MAASWTGWFGASFLLNNIIIEARAAPWNIQIWRAIGSVWRSVWLGLRIGMCRVMSRYGGRLASVWHSVWLGLPRFASVCGCWIAQRRLAISLFHAPACSVLYPLVPFTDRERKSNTTTTVYSTWKVLGGDGSWQTANALGKRKQKVPNFLHKTGGFREVQKVGTKIC